jgi:hypothetical protein
VSGACLRIESRARAVPTDGPGEGYEIDIRLAGESWERLCSFLVRSHNGGDRFLVRVKPGNVVGDKPAEVIWPKEVYDSFRAFVRDTEGLA